MMSNNTTHTTLLFTFEGPITAENFGAVITAWTVNDCRVRTDHVEADHVEMSVYGAPVDILTLLNQYATKHDYEMGDYEMADYFEFHNGTVVTWHYAPEGWNWPGE